MYTQNSTKQIIQRLNENCWTPDANLSEIPYVTITKEEDVKKIPKTNGAYWIVTNEPVNHSMFGNKEFPAKIGDFEIIYNGIAGNLQGRAKAHLLRTKCAGMSGISVDLYMGDQRPSSHIKAAFSTKKKVPYIDGRRVVTQSDLQKLALSSQERAWLGQQGSDDEILFWNGINVLWSKHRPFEWRFYFYEGEKMMTNIIEDKWRERYGKPRLCSYNGGR